MVKPPSQSTTDRRQAQLEALISAAETRICAEGVASLKARDLAADLGIALGGLYNIVADMDDLMLRVNSRTLSRLGAAAAEASDHLPMTTPAQALQRLGQVARTYLVFARENLRLWRMLFETHVRSVVPEWANEDQLRLFRHIAEPLAVLMPDLPAEALSVRARTLFAAVHGVISLGLEERLIAVPLSQLESEIDWLIRAACQQGA
ncbi:TetR-like C-terminal domain-containing protein [Asticcacaulis sp. EMRT-3]|uniref:TetR/AcrR family transcriptional regulator n=1 Tax=Asticcacaulis sp. EMRT-3 TaxID=3040349 RepID=UPI0024AEEE0C|nr:TetR-like C-terminal domain-containing protein [Asticcacaulis sp. EMRT-3]MDI7775319.1 TetR-like C-terminal domain-containing protein [Asticcacaulis sp. EMRT-3]